ncbi:F0F1 ATP synthase subunit B family protein [Streptomyces cinereoruber]|uniref:F0F1 ATP synthase subunit B family protein n=1 Tax=Streptomyces cinereoruber TaxID=67260 RepID=UPI00363781E2
MAKALAPKLGGALQERRAAITDGIDKAEAARTEAESVLAQHQERLAEASHEASYLRQKAIERSAQILAEMQEEGRRQRDSIIAVGHAQIETDRLAVTSVLRRDAGQATTDLAREMVAETMQDHTRQSRVIDRFLDELDEKAAAA